MAQHRGGGGHLRRDQVGAAALALPSLEVAVRGGRGALAGGQLVRVHAQTHRAARVPPFGAGLGEHLVQALRARPAARPAPNRARPASARRRRPCGPPRPTAAARRSSIRPLVQEPTKTVSTVTSRSGCPAVNPMYSRAVLGGEPLLGVAVRSRVRHRCADSGAPWPGLVPQVTNGASSAASMTTSASKTASSSVRSVFQYATAASQSAPSGACVAALQVVEGGLRPGRSCRPGRPPRSTCCRWSSGPPSTASRWPSRGTRGRSPGRRRYRSWRSPPGSGPWR